MDKTKKALYAVIPWRGDSYTVVFSKVMSDSACTESRAEGYGQLPAEYTGIPIIDYSNNDSVFEVLKWNLIIEESTRVNEFIIDISKVVSLNEFLNRVQALGIPVHNF